MNYFIIFLIAVIPSAYIFRFDSIVGTVLFIVSVVLAIINKYKNTRLVKNIINNYF